MSFIKYRKLVLPLWGILRGTFESEQTALEWEFHCNMNSLIKSNTVI